MDKNKWFTRWYPAILTGLDASWGRGSFYESYIYDYSSDED